MALSPELLDRFAAAAEIIREREPLSLTGVRHVSDRCLRGVRLVSDTWKWDESATEG
jgi:hypothetical protein